MIISFFILFSFTRLRGCIDPMRKKVRSTLFVLRFSYGRRLGVFDPFGFVPLASRGLACHGTSRHARYRLFRHSLRPSRKSKPVSAGLATGVRQLHSSHGPLLMNKPDDSSQRLNVRVHPDTQVLRTNPALGKNRSGFGKHQSSTANRAAAQMNEMPVVRVSVIAGVLAHRRNKYTVPKRNIPDRERIKQVIHGVVH
jgi:hypothetical protein